MVSFYLVNLSAGLKYFPKVLISIGRLMVFILIFLFIGNFFSVKCRESSQYSVRPTVDKVSSVFKIFKICFNI